MTTAVPPGLCGSCVHSRLITSGRGSHFRLCERSRSDPAFPRYPRLPVLRCAGYEPKPSDESGDREEEHE